jgi:hypothetical protein
MRLRYLVLAVWSLPWLVRGQHFHPPHSDWIFVELGARVLIHHHVPAAAGPALHVYADNAVVQIGPLALLLAGAVQWLPEQLGTHLALHLLALLVLPTLWCLERAASTRVGDDRSRRRVLLAGFLVVPAWTYQTEYWGHIDDALALFAMAVACLLVSQGDHALLAGLILGTGAATKPWAVILLPLLFAYSRPQVPRAVAAFIIGALGWWLPFVLADSATIHALGSIAQTVGPTSTWSLFGIHGFARSWMRPLQLLGGLVVATITVRRVGWTAVPLIALAWRVTSDPYAWPYYALGPLLGSVLWDTTASRTGRWWLVPWATLGTFGAELVVERELPGASPTLRLVWFLGVVALVASGADRRRGRRDQAPLDVPAQTRPTLEAGSPSAQVPVGLD